MSFEVKSKEIILDCKGKNVTKEYGKIVQVRENYSTFFYLNEQEKYLGFIRKDRRKSFWSETASRRFYINLIKKYFRKNDEKFSFQIKKTMTQPKRKDCDFFDKDASDYEACRLGSLYYGFRLESIYLNRYNLNISHTIRWFGKAEFSYENLTKKKYSSHAEYVFKNHTPGVVLEEDSFKGKCEISEKKI